VVIYLERVADLHMAQLMPLPLTVSCSSKISRLVLPFWYRLTWIVPDRGPLNVSVFTADADDSVVGRCRSRIRWTLIGGILRGISFTSANWRLLCGLLTTMLYRFLRSRHCCMAFLPVYYYYFFDPRTQFPGNEKITLCNTKSTKIKLLLLQTNIIIVPWSQKDFKRI